MLCYNMIDKFVLQMINQEDWYVPIEEIVFMSTEKTSNGGPRSVCSRSILSKSIRSENDSDLWDSDDDNVPVSLVLQWPGKYRGNMVRNSKYDRTIGYKCNMNTS